MKRVAVLGCALAATFLVACGEKPQTTQVSAKRSDTRAFQSTPTPYVAPGWKVGDGASWEEQMRVRVQNQNEYNRVR